MTIYILLSVKSNYVLEADGRIKKMGLDTEG